MAKTILIPIDFSIESLNTLKLALEQNKHEPLNVVLMYAETLSSSITELLFYSPGKTIQSLTSLQFNDAITIIKNTYESTLQLIRIELFHGFTKSALANFYEANKIDLVYLPMHYRLSIKKNAFDPIPLIKKSHIPYHEVSWNSNTRATNEDELNQLFKQ
ncbi:MAG: hypothetical protein V4613_03850 [Bacteroidota bacterium]